MKSHEIAEHDENHDYVAIFDDLFDMESFFMMMWINLEVEFLSDIHENKCKEILNRHETNEQVTETNKWPNMWKY